MNFMELDKINIDKMIKTIGSIVAVSAKIVCLNPAKTFVLTCP
jgi:hypothetical protein